LFKGAKTTTDCLVGKKHLDVTSLTEGKGKKTIKEPHPRDAAAGWVAQTHGSSFCPPEAGWGKQAKVDDRPFVGGKRGSHRKIAVTTTSLTGGRKQSRR